MFVGKSIACTSTNTTWDIPTKPLVLAIGFGLGKHIVTLSMAQMSSYLKVSRELSCLYVGQSLSIEQTRPSGSSKSYFPSP